MVGPTRWELKRPHFISSACEFKRRVQGSRGLSIKGVFGSFKKVAKNSASTFRAFFWNTGPSDAIPLLNLKKKCFV